MDLDTVFITEIIKSIGDGNFTRGAVLIAIFFVLWIELKGLKKQFKNLNDTIAKSFAAGERRFETIEKDIHQIRLDVDELKPKITQGGKNGNYQQTDFARGNA